jgi:ERCC4-related helicase
MKFHNLIDNNRIIFADELRAIASHYKHLSIATGYWDISGTLEILEEIREYESIRLLIGQEPLPHRLQSALKIDPETPESLFPDDNIMFDLIEAGKAGSGQLEQVKELRETASTLATMLERGTLQVKVFRKPRLHSKAFIFGTHETKDAIGIVGSSNFTKAGLTTNAELNSLESESKIVQFQPINSEQEHGHLSWFETLWTDPEAVEWTGDFSELIQNSPLGDLTFGPYDVYIKTLMEVFPDELIPPEKLSENTEDVLYAFQNRNAGILINKLRKMGVAMLSDSVGLGKTITSGAVIRHYSDNEAYRIIVIAPAALKQQWKDDLGSFFKLIEGRDFTIVSMQDHNALQRLIDDAEKPWMRPVDLFVIDEAHNLRSAGSTRHQLLLGLLQANPDSHVLMLTATPINNSLIDFANQIQLGSKGSLVSLDVTYLNNQGNPLRIDFFLALKIIQAEVRKAEREGNRYDWKRRKETLSNGLRHYLVRSTRQAVEKEGEIIHRGGSKIKFPSSRIEQIEYVYPATSVQYVLDSIASTIDSVFEGINPCLLNIDTVADLTQHTSHPLDVYKKELETPGYYIEHFGLPDQYQGKLFLNTKLNSVIPNVFQIINFLGFTPYRPELYKFRYHGKSRQEILDLGLQGAGRHKLQIAMAIHNILHVTWLKRLESSGASLLKSVEYYMKRIDLFKKYLDRGYIVTLSDASTLESEYAEDIERAFVDYDEYLAEVQETLDSGEDTETIKKRGVEKVIADASVYNLGALNSDMERDRLICDLLISILNDLSSPKKNGKLLRFAEYIENTLKAGRYGRKVLVFSFFADTIDYLQSSLPQVLSNPDFIERAEFITGGNNFHAENIARRFAPVAKKYSLKTEESELDYLFSTDVLSEGQNLQDAGILVNYDLHWNPVRMIQRNGRINRLGSTYDEVLVANARPHSDLELYLRLVRRLERKIDTIKNSIGTDQSVLGEEENPLEFVDYYNSDPEKASAAALAAAGAAEGELDILAVTDEYLFELRRFVEEHREDGELDRIGKIPLGKWNYLPNHGKSTIEEEIPTLEFKAVDTEPCMALARVTGKKSQTGVAVNETMFVSVETDGRYRAAIIEDEKALACIKTTPDNNQRLKDAIRVKRDTVARRMTAQARAKAESQDAGFGLKPKQIETLEIMQEYFPEGFDLQGIVRRGLRDSRQVYDFKKLVTQIRHDLREYGSVRAYTISKFEKLINQLRLAVTETTDVEAIDGVLFYCRQN